MAAWILSRLASFALLMALIVVLSYRGRARKPEPTPDTDPRAEASVAFSVGCDPVSGITVSLQSGTTAVHLPIVGVRS